MDTNEVNRKMKRLGIIAENCVGCRICQLSCSMVHFDGAFNPRQALIRVKNQRDYSTGKITDVMDRPFICEQCDPAPCREVCSVNAFRKDETLDIWSINPEDCTGCGECVEACPFDMVTWVNKNEWAMKCDLCGGNPVCALYCPTGALIYEEGEVNQHV
jgi:carbon-monoxide dehydrogenase iron sulfur subunit